MRDPANPYGVVGERVQHRDLGAGTVTRYEPLSSGLCDVSVCFDAAPVARYECRYDEHGERYSRSWVEIREAWPCAVASHELRYESGRPLPDRRDIARRASVQAIHDLSAARARLVAEWREPWPGVNFGKVHVGLAIDDALAEHRRRLASTDSDPDARPKGEDRG